MMQISKVLELHGRAGREATLYFSSAITAWEEGLTVLGLNKYRDPKGSQLPPNLIVNYLGEHSTKELSPNLDVLS